MGDDHRTGVERIATERARQIASKDTRQNTTTRYLAEIGSFAFVKPGIGVSRGGERRSRTPAPCDAARFSKPARTLYWFFLRYT